MPASVPFRTASFVCALAALMSAAGEAAADIKLNARYDVTLAGIEIGKAALVLDIDGTTYTAAASGKVTGVAQVVTDGAGRAAARGAWAKDRPHPGSFSLSATSDDKSVEVQFSFDKGAARNVQVTPPPRPRPDRIELTEAHHHNVVDPMTATVFAVSGSEERTGPEACKRVLPIFDGVARYDLTLEFVRRETVKAKGYSGPAAVCRVAFKAIAGHREGRPDVEYMERNKDVFVWLAPVADSPVLVPFKISVATKLGTCVVEAKTFMGTHVQDKAAPAATPAGAAR